MARFLAAAVAAAAVLIAGQAFAADPVQLSAVKGQVLVGRDGKLVQASPGTLRAGDRILARSDGQARLTYPDGCSVTLKPNAMITLAATSPCAGGVGLVSAANASAQATQQGLTALQWAGVGMTVVVLGVGLAAAADDVNSISP